MVHNTPHWEGFGRIPPQGFPQAYREVTFQRKGRSMVIQPTGRRDGGDGIAGCGDLHPPTPEQSHRVYLDQAHYGPVYGGISEAEIKGDQEVLGEGRIGCGRDADGGLGGGYGRDGYGYGLSWWEGNV